MELHCAEIVIGSGTLKMAGNVEAVGDVPLQRTELQYTHYPVAYCQPLVIG